MLLRNGIRLRQMAWESRWFMIVVTAWTGIVVAVDNFFPVSLIANPTPPVATLGIAVAFFLGFKNTSAFGRWWEARNIWGAIVNASRDWGATVGHLVAADGTPIPEADRRLLFERHIAWLNMLAFQLRSPSPFGPPRRRWMFGHAPLTGHEEAHQTEESWRKHQSEADLARMEGVENKAAFLLSLQVEHLAQLARKANLHPIWHTNLNEKVASFADTQGKCERLKNTPFPRQIAEIGSVFSWIFIGLLPLAMNDPEFAIDQWSENIFFQAVYHWLALAPIAVLVCWVFFVTERVSTSMEDPFEGDVTDVPMSALCRMLEIDMRQMTGWGKVPVPSQPIGSALY